MRAERPCSRARPRAPPQPRGVQAEGRETEAQFEIGLCVEPCGAQGIDPRGQQVGGLFCSVEGDQDAEAHRQELGELRRVLDAQRVRQGAQRLVLRAELGEVHDPFEPRVGIVGCRRVRSRDEGIRTDGHVVVLVGESAQAGEAAGVALGAVPQIEVRADALGGSPRGGGEFGGAPGSVVLAEELLERGESAPRTVASP